MSFAVWREKCNINSWGSAPVNEGAVRGEENHVPISSGAVIGLHM